MWKVSSDSESRVTIEGRTVLIVEDDAIVALAEKMQLEQYGLRVELAESGEAAIAAIETKPEIDLVLMDINLGTEMDGTEAAERIHAIRDLPLIFLSSHTERHIVDKTEGTTSYGYVVKNSGETVLLASIKMAIRLFDAQKHERESERARLETDRKFRNVVQCSPVGMHMYRLEDDGRLVFAGANEAADQILGVQNEQFVGMTIEEAFPGLAETEVPDRYREVARNGSRWDTLQINYDRDEISGAFEVHAFQTEQDAMVAMFTDITERERAEVALRRSEDRFRHLFDNLPVAISITAPDGTIEANRAFYAMLGHEPESGPLRWSEIIQPDDVSAHAETERAIMAGERDYAHSTRRFRRLSGSTVCAEVDTLARREPDGSLLYLITVATDTTEQVEARRAVAESERFVRAIGESVPVLVYVYDAIERRNVWVNSRHRQFLGAEVDGDPGSLGIEDLMAVVHPDDLEVATRQLLKLSSGDTSEDLQSEFRLRHDDGWAWMLHRSSVFRRDENGEVLQVIGSMVDITDRKSAEASLERANDDLARLLEERNLLFREMNHRVKNNLFVVKSLLDLREQAQDVDLTDVKNQVISISLVHELLYDSADFRHVLARQYVGAILESVFRGHTDADVKLASEIDDIKLGSNVAVAVGLVLNEAASNALRHAAVPGETLEVRVRLHAESAAGTCTLSVENSGRPLSDDIDLERPTTLGLQLLSALTRQLHGRLSISRTPRTEVSVVFPYEEVG